MVFSDELDPGETFIRLSSLRLRTSGCDRIVRQQDARDDMRQAKAYEPLVNMIGLDSHKYPSTSSLVPFSKRKD